MTEQTPGCGSNSEARKRRMEQGRVLASQREDLIAAGVDPADLLVPLSPAPETGHIGCRPGQCREGAAWRRVECTGGGGDVEAIVWAAFDAAVKAAAPDDPTGHLPNCGYINVEHETCACPEYGARLRVGLRGAITAALAAQPAAPQPTGGCADQEMPLDERLALTQAAADVLRMHRLQPSGLCACGELMMWRGRPWRSTHETHVAVELVNAGVLR